MTAQKTEVKNFADGVLDLAEGGRETEAMHLLVSGLHSKRLRSKVNWPAFVEEFRKHPVMALAQTCQFTARSFNKPRGYAGDAVMLDDIYGLTEKFPHPTTRAGRVYFYTTNAPAPWAVRERRTLLARLIDETSARTGSGRILALACGHARELSLSSAYNEGRLEEYVAFDQDLSSLETVKTEYTADGVKTVHGNIREIIAGRSKMGTFDLVYAAGLFDYLNQAAARRLAMEMYSSLRPGGTMLIPNFLPNIPDVGYMEACMDWWLTYRSEAEILDVFSDLPDKDKEGIEMFRDIKNNIGYGLVKKPMQHS